MRRADNTVTKWKTDKQWSTTYYITNWRLSSTNLTSGAGTANPSGAPEFSYGFEWGWCYSIFNFMCMFGRSLFVLLYFFFWPFCCLFFFDLRILITPLVSSNSSTYNLMISQEWVKDIRSNFWHRYFIKPVMSIHSSY
jgi:hypothetical protein